MKFKLYNKGQITSYFSDDSGYRPHTHTGVDWMIGYGKPVKSDNEGYVAHIDTNGTDGWRAVWIFSTLTDDTLVEVCYGHLKDINVKVGDWVSEDEVIGTEGNFGLVFNNGIQITPAMRRQGSKAGSHVHEQYRPVRLVNRKTRGKHYRPYKYDGKYVEVIHTNSTKGCIDPMDFATHADPIKGIEKALKEVFEDVGEKPTPQNVSLLRKLWKTLLKLLSK